jgi:hypothetical protein
MFSWDFELRGDGHVASLGFSWPREVGWIQIDRRSYMIFKHGFFSGSWKFVNGESEAASAQKRTCLTRIFDISTASGSFVLEASSFAARIMNLVGSGADATITPAHAFTRRAQIEGRLPEFEVVAIAFWLTALTWRRAAGSGRGLI